MSTLGLGKGKEKSMRGWHGIWSTLSLSLAALAVLAGAAVVRADVQSDQPAAILVFPKLLVDVSSDGVTPARVDTLVRITNASNTPVTLQCFYVNATPSCTTGPGNCITSQRFGPITCSGGITACKPQWQETDFHVVLTENQPVAWLVSNGAVDCQSTPNGKNIDPDDNDPCFPLDGIFRTGPHGNNNGNSRIPPVSELPFIGELKCITVDDVSNDQPVARNDVFGSVQIIESTPEGKIDISGYNAIGIQALPDNDGNKTLVLGRPGTPGVEYNGCPNILILDHFFDLATDPVTLEPVTTDLTLVPCSEDFLRQTQETITAQFIVFNEFEQRLSTSIPVTCFREVQLSNIDTLVNNRSIFSAPVMGTLTGQTRIRGVADDRTDIGRALLGVAEEYRPSGTAAFNIHEQGVREQNDFIYLPGLQ